MEVLLFWITAIVAILSALMVILQRQALHSAFWMILNLFCIAILYVLLRAPFLAAMQIIIYAGAIMVLFVFVIMLLNAQSGEGGINKVRWQTIPSVVLVLLFLGALMPVLIQKVLSGWRTGFPQDALSAMGTVKYVGMALFTKFSLPFEITSVILLIAMIGVIVLGKKKADT